MRFRPALLIVALVTSAPAAATTPAAAPVAPAQDCAALAAERTRLEAEHKAGAAAIADIAMGKKPEQTKRRGPSAGQVGEAAAGTAASVLLPFPFGPLFSVGRAAARAAARKKQKQAQPPAPEPDVEAMVRRQNEIETRLSEIGAAGC